MKITLTKDEAVVLYDMVYKMNRQKKPLFSDSAEQMVLWSLEAILEKELLAPCKKEYSDMVETAKENVRKFYGET